MHKDVSLIHTPGAGRGGGGRRKGFHIKREGLLVGNFENIPYMVPRSCFAGVAWIFKFFHHLKVPILKEHLIFCHSFSAPYPKSYFKSSHCGHFGAQHPKKCQNHILNPKKVWRAPQVLFTWEFPLWGRFPMLKNYLLVTNYLHENSTVVQL